MKCTNMLLCKWKTADEVRMNDCSSDVCTFDQLKPRLAREGLARVYERIDRPRGPVIAEMERAVIKVDREELARLSGDYAREIMRLEGEIHALAGRPFTIGSPKQLGEVLYGQMGDRKSTRLNSSH